MNFDDLIREIIDGVVKLDLEFSERNDNNNYDQFEYETVNLNYELINKLVKNYYMQKFNKEVVFSYVVAMKCECGSLKFLSKTHIPCVVLNEYFNVEPYYVLLDDNSNMNIMQCYTQVKSMVPSYIKIIDEDLLNKIFEINGYCGVMPGADMSGNVVGYAKRLVVNTTGRVLN